MGHPCPRDSAELTQQLGVTREQRQARLGWILLHDRAGEVCLCRQDTANSLLSAPTAFPGEGGPVGGCSLIRTLGGSFESLRELQQLENATQGRVTCSV